MKNEKLSIIYEPKPYIDDIGLLSSLCIYYDDVMLFSSKSISEAKTDLSGECDKNMIAFFQEPYKMLNKEGVLHLYTNTEVQNSFPKANDLEVSINNVEGKDGYVYLEIDTDTRDNVTLNIIKSLYNKKSISKPKISDLIRAVNIFSVAECYNIPILSNRDFDLPQATPERYVKTVSSALAIKIISKLALPELSALNYEDIILARNKLKDELLEFRSGILELSYYLCKNINGYSLADICYECDLLIETKIKASIMNLENAIRKHKDSKIRNLIFNTAKLLLTGSNLFTIG